MSKTSAGFTSEKGTVILEGEVWDLREATDAEIQLMAEQNKGKITMGWKCIPSCDLRGADVSTATALPTNLVTRAAWVGQGRAVFHEVPWEKAVLSHRIVNTLRLLPVVQEIGAVMTRYSVDLLIHEQRHME